MTRTSAQALAIAQPVVRILIVVNIVYGAVLVGLLVLSFLIPDWPWKPMGFDLVNAHPLIGQGLRAIVLIGIVGALVVHTILERLLAIIETVRLGDPFLRENAERLDAIAWRVAGLEVLRVGVAVIAAFVWKAGQISAFSFAPWLAVLLLFVLAGVFAQGERMRADLEGTI